MPSDKNYLDFVLDQLSLAGDVAARPMMGEYVLYHRGKVFGGIYDNRFLVKPTPSARAMMPDAPLESPYDGAKEMLLVDNVDNPAFLASLLAAMHSELPAPRRKTPHRTA